MAQHADMDMLPLSEVHLRVAGCSATCLPEARDVVMSTWKLLMI